MEIRHLKVGMQPSLGLDKATRDALADYCRLRWPQHTAKMAAREWGLTLDEAKGVCAGRTSIATMDRIFKHPNGGWSVAVPVLGAVIGQTIEDHFIHETQRLRNARRDSEARLRRVGESARALRTFAPVGPDSAAGGVSDRTRDGTARRG